MNISEKLPYVERAIQSISEHEDEDAQVRFAALDRITSMIASEKAKIQRKINERISEQLSPRG